MEYVVRVGWTGETYSAILVNEDDPRDIICEGLGETEERALSDLEDKRKKYDGAVIFPTIFFLFPYELS